MLEWILSRLRERRTLGRAPRIDVYADGFAVVASDGQCDRIRLRTIARVAAYKRDLLTTDEVIVAFEVVDRPGMVQEVSEEWTGFTRLLEALQQGLGISSSWYAEIVRPPFANNHRILFERVAG
jgi:hypothetical protein